MFVLAAWVPERAHRARYHPSSGPLPRRILRGKMIADTDVGVFTFLHRRAQPALIALCLLSLIWGIYKEAWHMRNHSSSASAANWAGAT